MRLKSLLIDCIYHNSITTYLFDWYVIKAMLAYLNLGKYLKKLVMRGDDCTVVLGL